MNAPRSAVPLALAVALATLPMAGCAPKEEAAAKPPARYEVQGEIVGLPSASVLSVVREELTGRPPAARTVAVFADPVFQADDARVIRKAAARGGDVARSAAESGIATLPRLHFSRDEADAIVALARGGSARKMLDFDASRPEAKHASSRHCPPASGIGSILKVDVPQNSECSRRVRRGEPWRFLAR